MKRKILILPLILMIAALLWGIEMFRLSGQTAEVSAGLSTGLIRRVLELLRMTGIEPASLDHPVRKAAHVSMFALEGALLAGVFVTLRRHPLRRCAHISAAICAVMAVLNEWVQTLAEGRSCEFGDMLLDFGGALLGILLVCLLARRRRRRAML